MADFSVFLGNHVRPITDMLTLQFLLFVIHNQKDLNQISLESMVAFDDTAVV